MYYTMKIPRTKPHDDLHIILNYITLYKLTYTLYSIFTNHVHHHFSFKSEFIQIPNSDIYNF